MMAPVLGSGRCPAWTARVPRRMGLSGVGSGGPRSIGAFRRRLNASSPWAPRWWKRRRRRGEIPGVGASETEASVAVLVVDDDATVVNLVTAVLHRAGIDAEVALD